MEEKEKYFWVYETKIGKITIVGQEDAIIMIRYGAHSLQNARNVRTSLLDQAEKQLKEYLEGERKQFDLSLKPTGTVFQEKVWKALCSIPYGETRSYGQIAEQIGNPKASRAVGMANNKNPIIIMIPCHRVIGANGKLVGYGAGLELKEVFLNIEAAEKNKL